LQDHLRRAAGQAGDDSDYLRHRRWYGGCNHSKIKDTEKWIGEDLARHSDRMTKIDSNAAEQAKWIQFQIDNANKQKTK